MRIARVLPFLVPVALLLGCQSQEPAQAPMQLAAGTDVKDLSSAALELATARCLSAERCFEFDADSKLGDMNHCRSVMKSEAAREIDFCPSGIDKRGVKTCAEGWTKGECHGAFAPLTAIPECRTEMICAH